MKKTQHDHNYHFSCWAINYDHSSNSEHTYRKNSLIHNDGKIVPLIWNHDHIDPTSVIGYASLEHRDAGVFVYGTLNAGGYYTPTIIQLIQNKGLLSLSPFITQVEYDGISIRRGIISEVSLVYERIDPNELYYPVPYKKEESDVSESA